MQYSNESQLRKMAGSVLVCVQYKMVSVVGTDSNFSLLLPDDDDKFSLPI